MNRDNLLILIADDDAGHATLVQRNLKRAGIINDIIHVRDGQAALDFMYCEGAFSDRVPNGPLLLLLDLKMPRIDGVEVLRRVKGDPRTAKMPVIVLTTTDDPREVQRCYELGCSVYVTKPVAYNEFIEAIQRLGLFLAIVKVPREDERP
jgi:CheY-like chemotaxis protein